MYLKKLTRPSNRHLQVALGFGSIKYVCGMLPFSYPLHTQNKDQINIFADVTFVAMYNNHRVS